MTLYVLVGPSGAGKTTLQHLFEKHGASGVVSMTTRTKRPLERDGIDYHFVSVDMFKEIEKNNGFLETAEFAGNFYGVDEESVLQALEEGKNNIAVLVTEINGFLEIKKANQENNNKYDLKGIFLESPKEILIDRLKKREGTTQAFLDKRLPLIDQELDNKKYFSDEIILSNMTLSGLEDFVVNIMSNNLTKTINSPELS